jgi:hypothetical protein
VAAGMEATKGRTAAAVGRTSAATGTAAAASWRRWRSGEECARRSRCDRGPW